MEAKKPVKLSFQAYIDIEKESNTKHEFHDGTVISMAGGTIEHGLIGGNTLIELAMKLRAKNSPCKPINSDVKLQIKNYNKYLYPDAMVVCNEIEKSADQAISNPTVIIEVLSKSTEGYDRGDKFFFYRQIPTLEAYILIDQYQPSIDMYLKKSDLWQISRLEGIDEQLFIPPLDIYLDLKNIYLDVF